MRCTLSDVDVLTPHWRLMLVVVFAKAYIEHLIPFSSPSALKGHPQGCRGGGVRWRGEVEGLVEDLDCV